MPSIDLHQHPIQLRSQSSGISSTVFEAPAYPHHPFISTTHPIIKPSPAQPLDLIDPTQALFDQDHLLDRLITITNQLINSSTTALASTITSRGCLNSLSKINDVLDRTIRARQRELERSLESIQEHNQTLDLIQNDLSIICPQTASPSSSASNHQQKILEEKNQLTQTILKTERENRIKIECPAHYPKLESVDPSSLASSPSAKSNTSRTTPSHSRSSISHDDQLLDSTSSFLSSSSSVSPSSSLSPSSLSSLSSSCSTPSPSSRLSYNHSPIDPSRLFIPTSTTSNTFPIHATGLLPLSPFSTPQQRRFRDHQNLRDSLTISPPSSSSSLSLSLSSTSSPSPSSFLSPIRFAKSAASTAFQSLYPSHSIPSSSNSSSHTSSDPSSSSLSSSTTNTPKGNKIDIMTDRKYKSSSKNTLNLDPFLPPPITTVTTPTSTIISPTNASTITINNPQHAFGSTPNHQNSDSLNPTSLINPNHDHQKNHSLSSSTVYQVRPSLSYTFNPPYPPLLDDHHHHHHHLHHHHFHHYPYHFNNSLDYDLKLFISNRYPP